VDHPQRGLFWLCVEIDENQHKSYASGYEEGRYNDLFMDFSGQYVFLRVNPDAYRNGGVRVDTPFEERLNAVLSKIETLLHQGPESDKMVEVHHLFYDQP